jgi:hypothetical protein
MTGVATAIAVTGIGASLLSASAQKGAAEDATAAQVQASEAGIEEQRRQFDKIQELLQPFVSGGAAAFTAQGALTGLQGPEAEQAAIDAIQAGPEFGALVETGEEAILQNAAATGGLRGGNVQRSLAQFRPQILSSLINQRFSRLGGQAQLGQASAAGVGSAALQTGRDVRASLAAGGEATAIGAATRGKIQANLFGDFGDVFGEFRESEFGQSLGF